MQGHFLLFFLVVFPMAAALPCYLIGRRNKLLRDAFAAACGLAELAVLVMLACSTAGEELYFACSGICSLGIHLVLDDFRRVYALVAVFMWAMTLLFSHEYFAHYRNRNRYYFFQLMTLGATVGVFLSADLYTTLIFFEIMSFTSYVWVAHEETEGAMRAANTYLGVAVIGGLVALMGLFLLWNKLGTLTINELYDAALGCGNKSVLYVAGACLLFGFGAKAGMFPLHIWLPKAHPVAPAPASALLSGILTKSGVYGILAISCNIFRHDPRWGLTILLLGVVTMVLGAVLALFSLDLKRTLACSSMSQIGFILVGVGMMGLLGEENALAARGVVLHMMNHSLIKLVLFMAAGVVYMNLHQLDLNAIRGFGRKKPVLNFCFLMGALGIGGVPLWNGYISKTLLHEGIVEYAAHLTASGAAAGWVHCVEWLFLISGGLTVAYMTKLYIVLFVEKHPTRQAEFDAKKRYMNPLSTAVLTVSALVLPLLGMTPTWSMNGVADFSRSFFAASLPEEAVHYFNLTNLKGAAISLLIGAAVYLLVVRRLLRKQEGTERVYVSPWPDWLDLENLLYRPLLLRTLPTIFGNVLVFFGENRLTTLAYRGGLAFFGEVLTFFGENKLTALAYKGAVAVGGVCARATSEVPDGMVVLLRKTVFRNAKEPEEDPVKRSLSYRFGAWLDRLFPRSRGKRARSVTFVRFRQSVRRTTALITGNLSFALMMCCFGLCLMLVYLLFLH